MMALLFPAAGGEAAWFQVNHLIAAPQTRTIRLESYTSSGISQLNFNRTRGTKKRAYRGVYAPNLAGWRAPFLYPAL
jgi:hypothetical protein